MMKVFMSKLIYLFGVLSLFIALVQIILGQTERNSIIEGFAMSYKYIGIGLFFIGLHLIINLLENIYKRME